MFFHGLHAQLFHCSDSHPDASHCAGTESANRGRVRQLRKVAGPAVHLRQLFADTLCEAGRELHADDLMPSTSVSVNVLSRQRVA